MFCILRSKAINCFLSAKASRKSSPPGSERTFSSTIGTSESSRACPSFSPEISATLPSVPRRIEAQADSDKVLVSGFCKWKRMNLA